MHSETRTLRSTLLVVLALLVGPAALQGQQQVRTETTAAQTGQSAPDSRLAILATEAYLTPPPVIRDAVLATVKPDLRLSNSDPSGQRFLRTVGDGFPTLERFARPHYDLGQFQIDPRANRSRRMTTRSDVGIEIYTRDGQRATTIQVPAGARVTNAQWSPDGTAVAYFAHFDDATHIYVADAATGVSRRLTTTPVLATHVTSFDWTGDGDHIVTVLVPANRGPEPAAPEVPETPKVRLTTPERNALRTYFDLLENPHEKRLVEYYSTGQLARIDVASGAVTTIGAPAMIEDVDASPDGEHFRVTTITGGLSYIVPVSSAGSREEIWDARGTALALLDEQDLNENVQDDDQDDADDEDDNEKRGLRWHGDGSVLVFLQQTPRPEQKKPSDAAAAAAGQDQDQDEDRAPRPDRVMLWRPPFSETSTEVLYTTEDEIDSVRFDESGRMLFLTRQDGDTRTIHAVSLDDPSQEFLIAEEDTEDLLARQGSLITDDDAVRTSPDGRFVYLEGIQYFEEPLEHAPRPFIDRVEIRTGARTRLFQSAADVYETLDAVLDDAFTEILVSRESPTLVPNQWIVNVTTGQARQVTFNTDTHPRITSARREMLTVRRADGFTSRVTVTLPPGYKDGTRLPAMFWFYPREYSEQETYDEGMDSFNKNSFPSVGARSMEMLTLLGYAVVEPDVPIVGPQGRMNDEYPHDLRNTLAAVIDALDERGWIDRQRLALGGHSYGAFGTANAMVQTPFFKAGIAGDGNYNRSLTPAGFQRERRYLWEAQDLYIEMSPFFQADRLSGALLMYHGMDDHNVGTHPIHADRMFHALEVLGKTAAMYKYPYEDHGPATRETTLDLWARWVAWLDLHVMNADEDGPDAGSGGGGASR